MRTTKADVALEGLRKLAILRMKAAGRDRTLAELELALLNEVGGRPVNFSVSQDEALNSSIEDIFRKVRDWK